MYNRCKNCGFYCNARTKSGDRRKRRDAKFCCAQCKNHWHNLRRYDRKPVLNESMHRSWHDLDPEERYS